MTVSVLRRFFSARNTSSNVFSFSSKLFHRPYSSVIRHHQRQFYQRRGYSSSSSNGKRTLEEKNTTVALWLTAVVVGTLGLGYAAVPLYRLFCQVTGYGGTVQSDADGDEKIVETLTERAEKYPPRPIRINFNADVSAHLPWSFVPCQRSVKCKTGESVLAFFEATNKSDQPIIGISTYNVTPVKAGKYFHKVQCFCFDEQRLRAKETMEMPVFFYVDPDIVQDKNCTDVTEITLSYTFFLVSEDGEPEEAFDEANQPYE